MEFRQAAGKNTQRDLTRRRRVYMAWVCLSDWLAGLTDDARIFLFATLITKQNMISL